MLLLILRKEIMLYEHLCELSLYAHILHWTEIQYVKMPSDSGLHLVFLL